MGRRRPPPLPRRGPAAEVPAAREWRAAARPRAGACRPGNNAAGARGGPAPHAPRGGDGRGSGSGAGCRCGSGGKTPLLFPPRARPPRRQQPPIPRRRSPRHRACEGTWGGVADPPPPAHHHCPIHGRHGTHQSAGGTPPHGSDARTAAAARVPVAAVRRRRRGGGAGRHHTPQIRVRFLVRVVDVVDLATP